MRRSSVALLAFLLAALVVACGPGATSTIGAPAPGRGGGSADASVGAAPIAPGALEKALPPQSATAGSAAAPGQIPAPIAFEPDRALILIGSVALRSKDPWAVAERAQAIAIGLGGGVMGLNQSGTGDQRSAAVTIRVPSDRFNEALRQLRSIDAEVLSSSVEGKDVTDQFVDLKARLTAKQAEEARYLALLTRADKIEDILKINQALSLVRTQVEQLTGQLNSIRSRTEFSTISVSVSGVPAVVTPVPGGAWDPSRTADRAVGTLLAFFRVAADAAIWLLVLGWLPELLILVAWIGARTLRRVTA